MSGLIIRGLLEDAIGDLKGTQFNQINITEPRCSSETPAEASRTPEAEGEGQCWRERGPGEQQTGDEDGNGKNRRAWWERKHRS